MCLLSGERIFGVKDKLTNAWAYFREGVLYAGAYFYDLFYGISSAG